MFLHGAERFAPHVICRVAGFERVNPVGARRRLGVKFLPQREEEIRLLYGFLTFRFRRSRTVASWLQAVARPQSA